MHMWMHANTECLSDCEDREMENENTVLKKILIAALCLILAAVSFFALAKMFSSADTFSGIMQSIDDKVSTTLKLTASATAASAGIRGML